MGEKRRGGSAVNILFPAPRIVETMSDQLLRTKCVTSNLIGESGSLRQGTIYGTREGRRRCREVAILPQASAHREDYPSTRRSALLAIGVISSASCSKALAVDTLDTSTTTTTATPEMKFEPEVRASDLGVFIAGAIPFVWATGEFWRRVLRGEVFGTGRDSVRFDQPWSEGDQPGGGRKLTSSALNAAYFLFLIAGGSLLLALVAFVQAK